MSDKYLIIHGHFYQPPRENPWMLAIEPQESAAPYDDWNIRINRECYAPNAFSRLLDGEGRIKRLVNNYQYLSFNFGPTLLSWLASNDPDAYARLLSADRTAAARMGGHGPALAQVYNHIIMPLANDRDKITEVRWGIADFKARFGREPEGMWLAETAVDLKTLEILSREGIKFTVLSQTQAEKTRPLPAKAAKKTRSKKSGETPWLDVSGGRIDPREPYRVFWGRGAKDYIDVFFYDGPVSRAIAFENLLFDGPTFLRRIEEAFGEPAADGGPRLVNLATDGESYGHHFAHGDMALAWLFNHLKENSGIIISNYGHYLSLFPPRKEAVIYENSSWSCAHGVERWRSDCGCNTGGGGGRWNQKWRTPLRNGLRRLGDHLAEIFESEAGRFLKNPWEARDDYVKILLADYGDEAKADFLRKHAPPDFDPKNSADLWRLMESQLMSLYMFTSCGWFFDDISGLEPVRNLTYALRAIELAQNFTRADLAEGFLKYLAQITPNAPEFAGGLDIWRRLVLPNSLNGRSLAAHWAASIILNAPRVADFPVPAFKSGPLIRLEGGNLEVAAGLVELFDRRLGESLTCQFLGIYSGGTHLAILVDEPEEPGADAAFHSEEALRAALGEELNALNVLSIWDSMTRLMPRASRFVMNDLMPHSRGALLSAIVADVYDDLKSHTRDLFHRNQHILMAGRSTGAALSWVERFIFRVMGEAELTRLLAPAAAGKPVNMTALACAMDKRGLAGIAAKDISVMGEMIEEFLERFFRALPASPERRRVMDETAAFIRLIRRENFQFDSWKSQNLCYDLMGDPAFLGRLSEEERELMREISNLLGFANPEKGSEQ